MADPFVFLHSSDLHLGKPFGQFPEGIRGRLREARHTVITRLAEAARAQGAAHVLLAGDTFDVETPARDTLAQAVQAMAQARDITWVLLPGNHDSLAAGQLWERMAAQAAPNVRLCLTAEPFELAPQVWILPAPCTQRRPGRDLTEAMQAATPEGALRIGLGHGGVTDFSSEGGDTAVIAPDRAERAGLDYLALGDWHGVLQIGPRTWYSGTPEADQFKHLSHGALGVRLAGAAQVTQIATGSLSWAVQDIALLPGLNSLELLQEALPPLEKQRNSLMQMRFSGQISLPERAALEAELARVGDRFGWFEADLAGLTNLARLEDLDQIDRAGALRQAAQSLWAESQDLNLPQSDRQLAAEALARLFELSAGEE